MRNALVPVYYGLTADDAQGLADQLKNVGVESFVDSTESPMYGMRSGPGGNVLFVRSPVTGLVRDIIRRYEHDGHPQVPPDERQREETGLEIVRGDRPHDDSPVEGVGETTELMNSERPGAEAPELEAFDNRALSEDEIESIGADRPLAQRAVFDSDEVQDRKIDELNMVEWYTEEEDSEERR